MPNHLFVTQDYPPVAGGMSRRHVELCRRLGPGAVTVSTVSADGAASFDAEEQYPILREPFTFGQAKLLTHRLRWARDVSRLCAVGIDVLHCGNIRPAGDPTWWAAMRHRTPYMLYVNGGDVLIERQKIQRSWIKRMTARWLLRDASAIIANSDWTASITRQLAADLRVSADDRIHVVELGTDPTWFRPDRDSGRLRERLGLGTAPLLITAARLVPHKGQDIAIAVLERLRHRIPGVQYLVVGTGPDEIRLRELAERSGVGDAVVFAGSLSDEDLAEAYATADVYVGLSRVRDGLYAEGFGISFVEAMSSGTPVVAGDSGGVRSAVADGVTGFLVPPTDVDAATHAITQLLRDPELRASMSAAGRDAVLRHYNWDRVASDISQLAESIRVR